jgi:CRISPR system Cascade subunit CasE
MPYLSRIYLNPLRTGAQNLLRNPQRMHAAVLGGLSRQPVTERVLWRLETSAHRASLLVLTQSTPSWEHLIEQAGWAAADEPQALVRSYQPLLDRAERGREYRFRLRANPVGATRTPQKPSEAQRHRLEAAERPRGVRVAHRTAAHQLQWLTDRVGKWGFSIPPTTDGPPDVRLGERGRMVFTKSGATSGRRVVIQTATFDGRLRIEDPELAQASLLDGVGAARAYGCGLITLAPIAT